MAAFGKAQYIKRVQNNRLSTDTGGLADNLARPNGPRGVDERPG
jgi:carbon-monoxide dehydrogenase large subunit